MSLEDFEYKRWLFKDPWGAVNRVVELEKAMCRAMGLSDPVLMFAVLKTALDGRYETLPRNVPATHRSADSDGDPGHQ